MRSVEQQARPQRQPSKAPAIQRRRAIEPVVLLSVQSVGRTLALINNNVKKAFDEDGAAVKLGSEEFQY